MGRTAVALPRVSAWSSRVWRDLSALRDPDRSEAWLHRLLVRECYREARHERRRTEVEVRVAEELLDVFQGHALRQQGRRRLAEVVEPGAR